MEFGTFKMRYIIALSLIGAFAHSEDISEFRLPTNFKPISYRLDVTTHLEDKFIFEGIVDIKVSIKENNIISLTINYIIYIYKYICR